MSNAFDKLMDPNKKRDKPSTSGAGGRPMHEHWSGYEKTFVNGKVAAKCRNCSKTFTNTAKARLSKHREICGVGNIDENESELEAIHFAESEIAGEDGMEVDTDSVSSEIPQIVECSDDSQPNSRSNSRPNSSLNYSLDSQESLSLVSVRSAPSEFRSPTPTVKQQKMKRFLDNVKPAESEKLDLMLAEFFYACNIPFAATDSIYFKKLVNALRPAYHPPHRHLFSGKLLDKVHEKIEKRNSELITKMDKQMTLLVDGWQNSSSNRHNVVMMLATSEDQKVFLESFDFSSIRETGENLFDAIKKAITLAKERYDVEVYAILSDNAYNMVSMGVAGGESLNLLYSTCNAHTANLLAGDILKTPQNAKIMAKVMSVQKEFKKTGLEDRLLKAGGHKPVLSCSTRWTSQRNAGESLVKNLSAMKTVTAACDAEAEKDAMATKPKASVSQLLFNADFLASVKKLLELLNPVAELTNYCQQSNTSAADAAEKWLQLFVDGPEELREFLKYRCKKSNVFNIVTMTANYFHPVYRGQKLDQEQRKEVKSYIFEKLEAAGLESCRMFTEDEGTFATLNRKKITNPTTFWHYAAEQGHVELATFAMKFLKIPASTAQLERLFSHWAYVHSDIRNRLSVETSKKLVNIYFTLRSTDEILDDDDDSYIEITE